MIDEKTIAALKDRYKDLHPLVFHRSLEKSLSAADLFDILENIPKFPFYWDDTNKKWSKVSDFYFIGKGKLII